MTLTPFGEKVIRSGKWVSSTRIIHQILYLIRTVILARLLSPNDFGLFGIALLTLSTLDVFSQTGFKQAIIQKKEDTKPYLDTAWTIGIIRAFLISIILFVIAPYVAQFFETPSARPILQIIGITVILQGLTNITVIYFEKELEFHKYFVYQLTGIIIDVTVTIIAAFLFRSVWAIVFGRLAGDLTRCAVSYILDPYRPRFQLDFLRVKELFGFGKWVLGSSILIFFITQGDDIFVGKVLGVTALGFYQMAYSISNLPATQITHVISQVTFPAYSKIQDDLPRLREAYLKVLQITAFLSFPIAGLIFVLAPDFTMIFLGEKWMPMVPAMQVLVFAGLVRSIAAATGPIFYSVGKPNIDTRWQIVRLFIIAALIYPFTNKWGILGTSIVVFISIFVANIGFSYNVIKITKCEIKNLRKTIVLPLINVIIMVLFIFFLKININTTGISGFLSLSGIGILVYLCITYLFDRHLNYRMQLILKESLSSFRGSKNKEGLL